MTGEDYQAGWMDEYHGHCSDYVTTLRAKHLTAAAPASAAAHAAGAGACKEEVGDTGHKHAADAEGVPAGSGHSANDS